MPIELQARPKLGVSAMVEEISLVLGEAEKRFLKFSETVRFAFTEIGDHINSAFYGVLTNLTNRMQTFQGAWNAIWQSMVQGAISAMARIVAAALTSGFIKLLGFLLSAVTNLPVFSMAGSAVGGGGGVISISPGTVPPPIPFTAGGDAGAMSARGGAPTGNVTYIIQTINAKDALQSLVSPMGQTRAANSRLMEVAAVS
jgi:hypothetical protein